MNLGDFRRATADLPDETEILKEDNYPSVEHVVIQLKKVGIAIGENNPYVDAGYEQKYAQYGKDKVRTYELTPIPALVISRYYEDERHEIERMNDEDR